MPVNTGPTIRFGQRLTVRLTGGVILSLLLVGAPFGLVFHRLQRSQQIETLEEATTGLSRIIVDGLRSAMVGGEPHLLDQALRGLAREPEVVRLLLIDHQGRVKVTSDTAFEGRTLRREEEETCRVCHTGPTLPESRSAVVTVAGQRVFRTMNVIANESECHACHDPAQASNGILLMDLGLAGTDRRFLENLGGTLALGSVMAVLTVGVLVLLLRKMVHSPLQEIVSTSQTIAGGDLEARARVAEPGEFAVLAAQVNRMTDHLARTLQTVENQRGELQSILDAVDDEIVVLDAEERVVAANRAFQDACGASQSEITGRPCPEVSAFRGPCAAAEADGCPVRDVFQTGRLHKGIFSLTDADGNERTIEIHASPLLSPDGAVTHAVEVRRDISERRQMEATMAHSERLASLGLLASGISHEINNPLAAIATSVEGLRRRLGRANPAADTAELDESLVRIAREVQRGRMITDSLLKVARRPGGSRSLIDVNRLVKDIVSILSHQIRVAGVEAQLDLAEDMPPLAGDEAQLGQVIMNLTLNALQSMEDGGGALRIRTSASAREIVLEVEDTGCGIAPELLNRIFEPFFTTKPVGTGTGLGLFITHRALGEMNGSIHVRSEPGAGTTFTVTIPRPGGEEEST